MEYQYLAVMLLIMGIAFGFALGTSVTFWYLIIRVPKAMADRDSDEEIQYDPRLAAIVGRVTQAALLAREGELTAAAGQTPCGQSTPSSSAIEGACDRPEDHKGPHAYHRESDLVTPVMVWEAD
jgi:hypothetical protein